MASAPNKSLLTAGGSYTTTLDNVVIPNEPTGSYYLFFVADGDNGQPQSSTVESVSAAVPLTLTAPNVDLQVTGTVVPSTSLIDDESQNVSWTIQNTGTETALDNSAYGWTGLRSTCPRRKHPHVVRQVVGRRVSGIPLAAGASYTQSSNITIPAVGPGSYYLLFATNVNDTQGESNYGNNVTAVAVTISAPELVITSAVANPATALPNSTVAVTYTVQNQGTVPALASSWYDWVYLSNSPTVDNSTQFLGEVYVNNSAAPLAAGASYMETVDVNIPNTATGSYYLLVQVDVFQEQGQTSRADNLAVIPITLGLPNVALAVTSASVPQEGGVNTGVRGGPLPGRSRTPAPTRRADRGKMTFIYPARAATIRRPR